MSIHKNNDYKLSAVKYYVFHFNNQPFILKLGVLNVQRCKKKKKLNFFFFTIN